LLSFAAAFAIPAFDVARDFLLTLFGFALCALGLSSCVFLTVYADLTSFPRRDFALGRGCNRSYAPNNQSNR
jgi:hypothetical protein